ncbi:MAG: tannase/feruloyl esterase family alpha/beta hydrolase [Roseiarcus sp.]
MFDEGATQALLKRSLLLKRILGAAVSLAALVCAAPAFASSCEDLANLKLPDTTIETAQTIPAGDYTTSDKVARKGMPAFCRVLASVKGAPDSDIRIEMWLPKEGWTGVFHSNGNGGYGGIFDLGYPGMEAAIKRGYASANTDMGTAPATPLDGDPLIGHPQKWKDWGSLSTHVMTVVGKAIAKAFYGEAPKRSYYTGCSTGGQQGLIEAEYFPADHDGILIGAPVVSRTWGHAAVAWDYIAANLELGHKLSDAKLTLLHKAAVAACNAKSNGLKSDPFIADPAACDFDAASLTCQAGDAPNCLTAGEVATAKAFYSGPEDHGGKTVYYGWPPGSEVGPLNWAFLEAPSNAPGEPSFDGLFKWALGKDWDWRKFDLDRDMPRVDAELGPVLNGAATGDFGSFKARGGKLLIFQGWADPIVAPYQTIALYKGLSDKFGGDEETQKFARLFMVPGAGHCGLGGGLNSFHSANFGAPNPPSIDPDHDLFTALARWVEDGVAPRHVIATSYVGNDASKGIAMQRPLCPHPQKAWYKGGGDPNIAGNYTCAVEGK